MKNRILKRYPVFRAIKKISGAQMATPEK